MCNLEMFVFLQLLSLWEQNQYFDPTIVQSMKDAPLGWNEYKVSLLCVEISLVCLSVGYFAVCCIIYFVYDGLCYIMDGMMCAECVVK